MADKDVRANAATYFVPFLLGSNRLSHKLSAKILRKYAITSFVVDKKRSIHDILDISSRFLRLSEIENPELLAQELIANASVDRYTLPLLVPCSPEYDELVRSQAELLEPIFVLCEADKLFSSSPLSKIP